MSLDPSKQASRRDIIKIMGGGAIAAGTGIVSLASVNTAAAQVSATTNLGGVEQMLDEDGRVDDIRLTGAVEGEYEAPNGTVTRAVAVADLDYHSGDDHPEIADRLSGSMHAETTFDDVNASSGSVSEEFELSLIDDWGFNAEDFTPDPGQTVSHRFLLVAGFRLFDSTAPNSNPIASALNEDYGTVEIEREQGDDDEENDDDDDEDTDNSVSLRLTESEFTFEVIAE